MNAVTVLISGGFAGAYERLLPEFEQTSRVKVTTRSGSSQGSGPQTIAAQLARGVSADVVILSREGLGELIAANRIVAGTDVDLAQVPLGVAVPVGTSQPDVTSVETFKVTMLRAKIIAVPESTRASGFEPSFFRGSVSRKRLMSRQCRAAPTRLKWSPEDARISPSCR
jgi:molybdate transport system substrate-binding protein